MCGNYILFDKFQGLNLCNENSIKAKHFSPKMCFKCTFKVLLITYLGSLVSFLHNYSYVKDYQWCLIVVFCYFYYN